jgi:hypothetical protein
MKNLNEAYREYKTTQKDLKPLLCLNQSNGLYLVTIGFSKSYTEQKGLKVIL